jgi:threonine dehydrogenase-like Zn-dependent dehydrogenase
MRSVPRIVQKELDILGSRNALPQDFHQVMEMLQAGRFLVEQTIARVVSLDEARGLLAERSAHPNTFTKIMIDFNL